MCSYIITKSCSSIKIHMLKISWCIIYFSFRIKYHISFPEKKYVRYVFNFCVSLSYNKVLPMSKNCRIFSAIEICQHTFFCNLNEKSLVIFFIEIQYYFRWYIELWELFVWFFLWINKVYIFDLSYNI